MFRSPAALLSLALVVACADDGSTADPSTDVDGTTDTDANDPDIGVGPDAAEDAGADAPPDTLTAPGFDYGGVEDEALVWRAGDDHVRLGVRLRRDNRWVEPQSCEATDDGLTCRFLVGDVVITPVDGLWEMEIVGSSAATVEGVELVGTAELAGATARLSNGFQSWSQSGVVALAPPLDEAAMVLALTARGDAEVIRDGRGPSWFHSFVGGGANGLVAGVTGPSPFRSWIEFADADAAGSEGALSVRLGQGGAGSSIQLLPGERLALAPWFIGLGDDIGALQAAYGDAVRVMEHAAPADRGWNSWYELWSSVDDEAVVANAEIVTALPGDLRIVIDDGWQQAWGDWFPNEKFPDGLDGLADTLRTDGFDVGVWLAPLLASEDSEVYRAHPEWFVPGVTWNHLVEGRMRVLDVTHPDAAAHLQDTIRRLVGWGMTLLKIDFLFAGTFDGERAEQVTGMQAYDEALRLIREAAGDEVVLLAVGAPGVPSFPYVQSWRIGPDIAVSQFDASWFFLPSEARTIAARWMFCDRILCDGDPPILRTLARNEVDAGVWIAALAGGAFFLSDDLRVLAEERLGWIDPIAIEVATSGRRSRPLDLVPDTPPTVLASALTDQITQRNNHVVPRHWRLPDGADLLLNLGEETMTLLGREVPPRSALRVPAGESEPNRDDATE